MSKITRNVNLGFFKRFSLTLKLTKIINNFYKKNNISGIAVGIALKDNILYENYLGVSNFNPNKMALSEKTLMPWNSISHLLTTIMIVKLAEKNKIDLEADIRTYIQDFLIHDDKIKFKLNSEKNNKNSQFKNHNQTKIIENKNTETKTNKNNSTKAYNINNDHDKNFIKVKDILSHRLGIDYREDLFNENSQLKSPLFDKNLKIKNPDYFIDNIPLIFSNSYLTNKPGTYTYFSNSNYLLLGKIICELTQKDFINNIYEVLRNDKTYSAKDNINPLLYRSLQANYGNEICQSSEKSNKTKLNHLYMPFHKSDIFYNKQIIEQLSDYSTSTLLPSYGIISNLKDLLELTMQLDSETILNDSQKRFCWEYTGNDMLMGDFGNGFMLFNRKAKKAFENESKMFSVGYIGGALNNDKQILKYYPNINISLVIMTNDEASNLNSLVKDLENIFEAL